MLRSFVSSPLGASLLAALLVAAVELLAIGSGASAPDLAVTVLSLAAALGLTIGFLLWLTEALAAELYLSLPTASLVRALPALPPLAWLGRTLFQGASAASLPGAPLAPLWVPAAGTLLVAASIALGCSVLTPPSPARRALAAGACLATAALFEVANRRLFQAEYADLHAFVIPVVCVLVTAGLRAATTRRRRGRRSGKGIAPLVWRALVGLGVLFGVELALVAGLQDADSRWLLATQGSDGRQLVRLVRGHFDLDGDGFASVLGGGDCDDGDPAVNPGAAEVPANGVDEDCDGADAEAVPNQPGIEERLAEELAPYRSAPARAELLRRAARWNLLLLSVDALRADVVSDTPANRKAYPHLFALFDRSRRFDRAFSPASGTDLSVSSVMTGVVNPFRRIDTTLFEALRRRGRATHAVLPREVLRYAGENLLVRGLDGRDVIVNDEIRRDVSTSTTSAATTRRGLAALARLSAGDAPFMLWLHYFDAHEHLQIEADDPDLRAAAAAGGFDLATRLGKYRALVGLIDREIGRVVAELDRRGLADRTAIVFFSDHGESMGEDPRLPDNHGLFLYHPLVHVPLVVHVPGGPAGPSGEPITLLDITPTLLELFGAPKWAGMAGRSLVPILIEDSPAGLVAAPRPLPLNESDQRGVIRWPYKLLVRPRDNLVELYDLSRDPHERVNRAAREPATVRRLKALYQQFPRVKVDRSRRGREIRDRLALSPARR
ncbi:MAG TPA: sulfatase-like hydrolase/transferase [Kofleriaceae bacterium]|nr:sulfatase-like hydrolase/transferase [Kofleriaceae bacterium]